MKMSTLFCTEFIPYVETLFPGPEVEYDLDARRLAGLDEKTIQIFAE